VLFAIAATTVADPTGPMHSPIFSGMNLAIVMGILFVGYIYLWLTNTEAALRLTAGVAKGLFAIIIGLAKIFGNLFRTIGRWIARR